MTRDFLNAMNAAVTGVTVVTTRSEGRPLGQTVRAMCSVSDAPPELLVAVEDRALAAAIVARGAFMVNVLADHQAAIAEAFSGRGPRPFVFATRDWWPVTGGALPVLHGAAARFECRVARVHEGTLIVGSVVRAVRAGGRPLAFVQRGYVAPLAA
jgi:flavin reductase (DIM6/NTAB) family NADH-FMN oxidoreductase RutF